MSPWSLVAVAVVTGALVFWRSSRIAGGALLLGAVVVAAGVADVSPLPSSRPDSPWVLRVTLDRSAPRSLPDRLTERWVDVPSVGSARPDAQGRIVVRGEPGSNAIEMNAVKVALARMPHVETVERIR